MRSPRRLSALAVAVVAGWVMLLPAPANASALSALPGFAASLGDDGTAAPAAKRRKKRGARRRARCPRRARRVRRRARRRRARRRLRRSPARCRANPTPSIVRLRDGKNARPIVTEGGFPAPKPKSFGPEGDEKSEKPPPSAGRFVQPQQHREGGAPPGVVEDPPEPEASGRRAAARAAAVGDVTVIRNRSLKAADQPVAASLTAGDGGEQGVATNGKGLVLYTANTFAALSANGGRNFADLNPRTLFPTAAGGFCCDQVVTYVPKLDRFVWIVQEWRGSGGTPDDGKPNVLRLATATSAELNASGGKRWTQYVFEPSEFGLKSEAGKGALLDRPHIAHSNQMLYMTIGGVGSEGGRSLIMRFPLRELGKTLNPRSFGVKEGGWIRPAQNQPGAPYEGYQYFAQFTTTSRLRVWEANDGVDNVRVYEVDVPTVADKNFRSLHPAGGNWMQRTAAKQSGVVVTGARAGEKIWFAWVAGREARVIRNGKATKVKVHDQPAIEAVAIDFRTLKLVDSDGIEYSDAATNLPQLHANKAGELGVSFMFGGPTRFPTHAVGFLRNSYGAAVIVGGQRGDEAVAGGQPGDYLGIAPDPAQPNCLVAAGSAARDGVPGTNQTSNFLDPHFAVFGRAGAGCRNPVFGTGPFGVPPSRLGP